MDLVVSHEYIFKFSREDRVIASWFFCMHPWPTQSTQSRYIWLRDIHIAKQKHSVVQTEERLLRFVPGSVCLRTAAVCRVQPDSARSYLLSTCKVWAGQPSSPETPHLWWVSWTRCVSPTKSNSTITSYGMECFRSRPQISLRFVVIDSNHCHTSPACIVISELINCLGKNNHSRWI